MLTNLIIKAKRNGEVHAGAGRGLSSAARQVPLSSRSQCKGQRQISPSVNPLPAPASPAVLTCVPGQPRGGPAEGWPVVPGASSALLLCPGVLSASFLSPAPLSWSPQCVSTLATTRRASCRRPSWCRPATCRPEHWVHRKPRPGRRLFRT